MKDLEENLEIFMRAVRPIGSSSGLIHAARKLEEEMMTILDQMRFTAAKIWTKFATTKERPQSILPEDLRNGPMTSWKLAKSFRSLSETLQEFLESLQDIPEFADKRLEDSLEAFRYWLEYRANALNAYEGMLSGALKLLRFMKSFLYHVQVPLSRTLQLIGGT